MLKAELLKIIIVISRGKKHVANQNFVELYKEKSALNSEAEKDARQRELSRKHPNFL